MKDNKSPSKSVQNIKQNYKTDFSFVVSNKKHQDFDLMEERITSLTKENNLLFTKLESSLKREVTSLKLFQDRMNALVDQKDQITQENDYLLQQIETTESKQKIEQIVKAIYLYIQNKDSKGLNLGFEISNKIENKKVEITDEEQIEKLPEVQGKKHKSERKIVSERRVKKTMSVNLNQETKSSSSDRSISLSTSRKKSSM